MILKNVLLSPSKMPKTILNRLTRDNTSFPKSKIFSIDLKNNVLLQANLSEGHPKPIKVSASQMTSTILKNRTDRWLATDLNYSTPRIKLFNKKYKAKISYPNQYMKITFDN